MNNEFGWNNTIRDLDVYDNKIHMLVFITEQNRDTCRIIYNLEHYYRRNYYVIDFVVISSLIGESADVELINILSDKISHNRIAYFYIVPQSRQIRQQLRELFLKKTGVSVPICLYSKIVVANNINDMRKI